MSHILLVYGTTKYDDRYIKYTKPNMLSITEKSVRLCSSHYSYDQIFDITFNGSEPNTPITSVNDVKSITLSLSLNSSNETEVRLESNKNWEDILKKRHEEINKLNIERNTIMHKLESKEFMDDDTNKKANDLLKELMIISMQIGNHSRSIHDLFNSSCEIKFEKRTDVYSIELFRGVVQNVNMPDKNFSLRLLWFIDDEEQSSTMNKMTKNTNQYNITIPKISGVTQAAYEQYY